MAKILFCVADNRLAEFFLSACGESALSGSDKTDAVQVLVARDGFDAYAKFIHQRPDILIADYALAKINGPQLSLIVREQGFNTPVLLFNCDDLWGREINHGGQGKKDIPHGVSAGLNTLLELVESLLATPDRDLSDHFQVSPTDDFTTR